MAEDTNKAFDDIVERDLFVELVADGTPEMLAGMEVGWTPRQTRLNLADPMFFEIVEAAKEMADGTIEHSLFVLAKKGNLGAIQMWLYNRQSGKWKDVKRIEVQSEHHHSVSLVSATKTALAELIREAGPAALQAGGPLDIIDAEVVDDGDSPAA